MHMQDACRQVSATGFPQTVVVTTPPTQGKGRGEDSSNTAMGQAADFAKSRFFERWF
jgi:hypothetical protein